MSAVYRPGEAAMISLGRFKNSLFMKKLKANLLVQRCYNFFVYFIFKKPYVQPVFAIEFQDSPAFLLDYRFGIFRYDRFGDRHNAGFQHCLNVCQEKSVVFDVGAHIGLYTLPLSRVLAQGGRVVAFEPSAANVRSLRRHLEINRIDNVEIQNILVAEANKDNVIFYEADGPDPMNAMQLSSKRKGYEKVFRQQVSLDQFCDAAKIFPEVMKIDVEGAEFKVLQGAQQLLREKGPQIFLSVHPQLMALFGDSIEGLKSLIKSLGYQIFLPNQEPATELVFGEYFLRKGV